MEDIIIYTNEPVDVEFVEEIGARSILGDIISPIKDVITDAFNTFKGPLGTIVGFVMNNVLSQLIQFIATAVEDIFPGLGYVANASVNILDQLIKIVPDAAKLLKDTVQTLILAIDGLVSTISTSTDDLIKIISFVFNGLLSIGQNLMSKFKKLVAKTSGILVNVGTDFEAIANGLATDVTNAIGTSLTALTTLITDIPADIINIVSDSFDTVVKILAEIIQALSSVLTNLVISLDSIVQTVITTLGQQLNLAVNELSSGIQAAVDDITLAIQAAESELVSAANESKLMITGIVNAGIKTSSDVQYGINDAVSKVHKGLSMTTSGAKTTLSTLDELIGTLKHNGPCVTAGLICGTFLVAGLIGKEFV